MSPIEIVAIVAMTGYAIYKQTVVSVVATNDGSSWRSSTPSSAWWPAASPYRTAWPDSDC